MSDMNNPEHDADLRMAKLYLSLGKDEMQNVLAEHRKRDAQRKAATAYGDTGSPVEPVTFIPLAECDDCQDPLYHENRSGIQGVCIHCLANRAAATAPPWSSPRPTPPKPIPWLTVALFCIFVVIPVAAGGAWLLAEAFWNVGQ